MNTKVLKLEVVIVNHEDLSEEDVCAILENARYHCISPKVVSVQSREVEWHDEHPLNYRQTFEKAYKELFS